MKVLRHHLLWPVILAKSGVLVSAVNVDISTASGGQVDVNYINDLGLTYPTVPRDVSAGEDYPNFGLDPQNFVEELLDGVHHYQDFFPVDDGPPAEYSPTPFQDVNETYSMPMMENYLSSQVGVDGDGIGADSPSGLTNLRNLRHLMVEEDRHNRKHNSRLDGSPLNPPADQRVPDDEMAEMNVFAGDVSASYITPHTKTYGYFRPLECNANLDSATCPSLTNLGTHQNNKLVIPCGECYTWNLSGDVSYPGGIHIIGKLSA